MMKKLLGFFGAILLSFSTVSTVVSCGSPNTSQEVKPDDQNSDDQKVISNFLNTLNNTLVVDTNTSDENQNTNLFNFKSNYFFQNEENILKQKEDILLLIQKKLDLNNSIYKIEILDLDFKAPLITGLNENNQITSSTKITLGEFNINLLKENKILSTKKVSWNIKNYEMIWSFLDLFNIQNKNNQFDVLLGSFQIPMIGELKVTFSTLSSLISLLPILESFSPNLWNAIINIQNLDILSLSQFDPLSNEGKEAYLDFENKFISSFEIVFDEAGKLLKSFGISDSIIINGKTIKISDFLNINLFDIFDLQKEQIIYNVDSGIGIVGEIPIKIDIKTGKEYGITIRSILLNIAPDLVKFLRFVLNSDSYVESNNLIFELIKYFLSDVDSDLKVINEKNFKSKTDKNNNEYNYNKAVTNLDSLVYNFISGFNSNKRGEKGNFSIKINLEKTILVFIKLKINSYASDLLTRIYINPTKIFLTVINNLLQFDTLNANGVNVKEDKKLFDGVKVIEDWDLNGLNSDGNSIPTAVQAVLKPDTLNDPIADAFPDISIGEIAEMMINSIIPSLLEDINYNDDLINFKIEKGIFNIMFLNENNDWVSLNEGLSLESRLSSFKNVKVSFKEIQILGEYSSASGKKYEFLTNDDLSLTLVLS